MTRSIDRRRAAIDSASALLVDAFDDYNARFSDITRRAQRHFMTRDWAGQQRDASARIALYDQCIAETIDRLERRLGERLLARGLWLDIRRAYAARIDGHIDAELYKTFFNTVVRRLFKIRGADPRIEFIALDIEPTSSITRPSATSSFLLADDLEAGCRRLLAHGPVQPDPERVSEDAQALARRLQADLARGGDRPVVAELLDTVFFRDRRAWRIGRLIGRTGWYPLVIALEHDEHGIGAAAVLTDRRSVSILFGYTYSYFHADLPTVGDAVVFLRTLLPDKPVAELYTALGRLKQGKTERYRHFIKHLGRSRSRFIEAEGTRGMVMLVFTLPDYPLVFKLVRDRFAPGKKPGREHVLAQYRLVFNHDRAGRLIDAQEFRHLAFDRDRFAPELLELLVAECGKTVQPGRRQVLIRHCFVQRRVRPLNLFLAECTPDQACDAVDDYGQALKDLAASNLFPGDLYLKNFGRTASGRVVCYDYDEVALVTNLNFRRIPKARTEEQAMSDEPWYAVRPGDVFPEEFPRYLDLAQPYRRRLIRRHGELFDPQWWCALQASLRSGAGISGAPYPERCALRPPA